MHFQWESPNTASNEARGPIVAVKSLNDVPREQLQAKKLQNDVTPNSDPYKHKKRGSVHFEWVYTLGFVFYT